MPNSLVEQALQITLKQYFERVIPGCEVVAIKNEAAPRSNDPVGRMNFQARRRASGVLPGVPDLMLVMDQVSPPFCEVKRRGGLVEYHQVQLHERWRAKGHHVFIASDIESARLGLKRSDIRTIEHNRDLPMWEPDVRYQLTPPKKRAVKVTGVTR